MNTELSAIVMVATLLYSGVVMYATWKWDEKLPPNHPNKGWAIAWGLIIGTLLFLLGLGTILLKG